MRHTSTVTTIIFGLSMVIMACGQGEIQTTPKDASDQSLVPNDPWSWTDEVDQSPKGACLVRSNINSSLWLQTSKTQDECIDLFETVHPEKYSSDLYSTNDVRFSLVRWDARIFYDSKKPVDRGACLFRETEKDYWQWLEGVDLDTCLSLHDNDCYSQDNPNGDCIDADDSVYYNVDGRFWWNVAALPWTFQPGGTRTPIPYGSGACLVRSESPSAGWVKTSKSLAACTDLFRMVHPGKYLDDFYSNNDLRLGLVRWDSDVQYDSASPEETGGCFFRETEKDYWQWLQDVPLSACRNKLDNDCASKDNPNGDCIDADDSVFYNIDGRYWWNLAALPAGPTSSPDLVDRY